MTFRPDAIFTENLWNFIAQEGSQGLQIEILSKTFNLPLFDLQQAFPSPFYILAFLFENRVQHIQWPLSYGGMPKDRLFDVIMAIFDSAQEKRKALSQLYDDIINNPQQFLEILPLKGRALRLIQRAYKESQIELSGFIGWMKTYGLLFLCCCLLKTWRYDETSDLSETMAILDQKLTTMESFEDFCQHVFLKF